MTDTPIIQESQTLRQQINEVYGITHACFTELEYALSIPELRKTNGYINPFWAAWKHFHLLYNLTYHESEIRNDKDLECIGEFFDGFIERDGLKPADAIRIVKIWKMYDRALRNEGIISLGS